MEATRKNKPFEKPINASERAREIKEIKSGKRLSKRETSQPEMGSPIRELTGIAINRFPSSASLRSKAVFIVGILDAHVEKAKPERKKYVLREIRLRLPVSIYVFQKMSKYLRNFTSLKTD